VLRLLKEICRRNAEGEFLSAIDAGDRIASGGLNGWLVRVAAALLPTLSSGQISAPRAHVVLSGPPNADTIRAWLLWAISPEELLALDIGGACAADRCLVRGLARVAWSLDPERRGRLAELLAPVFGSWSAYAEIREEELALWALVEREKAFAAAQASRDGRAIHEQSLSEELAERYLRESLDLRERIGDQFLVRRSLGGICQALVSRGDVDRAESIAADLYRQGSEATDLWAEQSALHYLSDCALIRGDFGIAEQRYARTAAYAWEHGNRTQCANEMHGVAMAASANGDYARALRIAAAASAEWERIWEQRGAVLALPFWTRLQEEHFGRARTALGPEASAAADAEGRALPFELVVKDAVKASTVADTT